MIRYLWVMGMILAGSACISDNQVPSGLIQPEQMKSIVWDMIKAGEVAKYDTSLHKTDSLKDQATEMFQKVFAIHHTDREQFYKSYTYYLNHPDLNKALFDSVSSLANVERNLIYKLRYAKPDTLRKRIQLK